MSMRPDTRSRLQADMSYFGFRAEGQTGVESFTYSVQSVNRFLVAHGVSVKMILSKGQDQCRDAQYHTLEDSKCQRTVHARYCCLMDSFLQGHDRP